MGFSFRKINTLLSHKYKVQLGKISYGFYVYHLILDHYIAKYVFDPVWVKIPFTAFGLFSKIQFHSWIVKFPLYIAVTFALAYYSFRYFEMPMLSLKDQYFSYDKTEKPLS